MEIRSDGADSQRYNSTIKIVYFTDKFHTETLDKINIKTLTNATISNLLGLNEFTYTRHNLSLDEDNFILVGINDEVYEIEETDMTYFTLTQIQKKGMKTIMRYINEITENNKVFVVFDMAVMDRRIAPAITKFGNSTKGLSLEDFEIAMSMLNKNNIVGLDITGYDLRMKKELPEFRVTCEIARNVLKYLLDIKEKRINIFNESSRFLIWRPIEQKDHDDLGWFILRGIPFSEREKLIDRIGVDNIISTQSVDENDEPIDVYITTTTIEEQEEKIYSMAQDIKDCILYSGEKVNMMFELINQN